MNLITRIFRRRTLNDLIPSQIIVHLNQSSLSGIAGSFFYWLKTGKIWVILTEDDHQNKQPPLRSSI